MSVTDQSPIVVVGRALSRDAVLLARVAAPVPRVRIGAAGLRELGACSSAGAAVFSEFFMVF